MFKRRCQEEVLFTLIISIECIYQATKTTISKKEGEEGTWKRYLDRVLVEGIPYTILIKDFL